MHTPRAQRCADPESVPRCERITQRQHLVDAHAVPPRPIQGQVAQTHAMLHQRHHRAAPQHSRREPSVPRLLPQDQLHRNQGETSYAPAPRRPPRGPRRKLAQTLQAAIESMPPPRALQCAKAGRHRKQQPRPRSVLVNPWGPVLIPLPIPPWHAASHQRRQRCGHVLLAARWNLGRAAVRHQYHRPHARTGRPSRVACRAHTGAMLRTRWHSRESVPPPRPPAPAWAR